MLNRLAQLGGAQPKRKSTGGGGNPSLKEALRKRGGTQNLETVISHSNVVSDSEALRSPAKPIAHRKSMPTRARTHMDLDDDEAQKGSVQLDWLNLQAFAPRALQKQLERLGAAMETNLYNEDDESDNQGGFAGAGRDALAGLNLSGTTTPRQRPLKPLNGHGPNAANAGAGSTRGGIADAAREALAGLHLQGAAAKGRIEGALAGLNLQGGPAARQRQEERGKAASGSSGGLRAALKARGGATAVLPSAAVTADDQEGAGTEEQETETPDATPLADVTPLVLPMTSVPEDEEAPPVDVTQPQGGLNSMVDAEEEFESLQLVDEVIKSSDSSDTSAKAQLDEAAVADAALQDDSMHAASELADTGAATTAAPAVAAELGDTEVAMHATDVSELVVATETPVEAEQTADETAPAEAAAPEVPSSAADLQDEEVPVDREVEAAETPQAEATDLAAGTAATDTAASTEAVASDTVGAAQSAPAEPAPTEAAASDTVVSDIAAGDTAAAPDGTASEAAPVKQAASAAAPPEVAAVELQASKPSAAAEDGPAPSDDGAAGEAAKASADAAPAEPELDSPTAKLTGAAARIQALERMEESKLNKAKAPMPASSASSAGRGGVASRIANLEKPPADPPKPKQAPEGAKFRDVREFWSKHQVTFAGPPIGKKGISKVEAQATLQRLLATSHAVDFNEVRRLKKLVDDAGN